MGTTSHIAWTFLARTTRAGESSRSFSQPPDRIVKANLAHRLRPHSSSRLAPSKRTPPADSGNTPIEDTDKTNSHIDMRMPEV